MNQTELNELYDEIYDLKGNETLEFETGVGHKCVITKDSMYRDTEAFLEMDPDLTDEELSDPDFGNLINIQLFEGDSMILSSDDIHILDFNIEELYEGEMTLFDDYGEEITEKEWLALEEEKEV